MSVLKIQNIALPNSIEIGAADTDRQSYFKVYNISVDEHRLNTCFSINKNRNSFIQ